MPNSQESRKWVWFFALILFWFATLAIFLHNTLTFSDGATGASVATFVFGVATYLGFVED